MLVAIVLMASPISDDVVRTSTEALIVPLLLVWVFHFGSVVRIMNLE